MRQLRLSRRFRGLTQEAVHDVIEYALEIGMDLVSPEPVRGIVNCRRMDFGDRSFFAVFLRKGRMRPKDDRKIVSNYAMYVKDKENPKSDDLIIDLLITGDNLNPRAMQYRCFVPDGIKQRNAPRWLREAGTLS